MSKLVIAVCLVLASICYFVLPGTRFSGYLFVGIAALVVLGSWLAKWKSDRGHRIYRAFILCVSIGCILGGTTLGTIVWYGQRQTQAIPADAVIVLGAGVNGETPSLTLQGRIDAAVGYATAHPDSVIVLSGGQGPGEAITEAEAMRRGMEEAGIDPARLLLEEDSTSTAENFAFSKALLQGHGLDTDTATIAVVSNDFHLLRASFIAQREGLSTFGVASTLPWWFLNANYSVREVFALAKTLVFD